ncbi:unnamed protein product [Euphydryas editha]|uniref:MADF domain-containing protein n=1 Tax=Euphydryas editha TaxID=104508 RepID=A0AAU9TXV9_EUPED|nr:unnamed protein product [Euphydryas editha]
MASSKRTNNDSFIEMDYKNIFMKNKIWDEIGEKCNISGDEAKMKWKNLRDTYGKYLKTTKTTTGQSALSYSRYSKWQWASSMEFLKDHIGFAPTDTNVAREEERVSDTQNITEPESYNENSTQRSSSVASSERYTSRSGSRKRTSVNEHPVDKVITYLNTKADKLSSIEHVMLGYAKTIDSPQSTNDSELQSALRCIQDNALSPLAPSLTGEGLDYEHEIDYDQQKHSEIK